MAVFYTAASLSGTFSELLAFAIEKMDGIAGERVPTTQIDRHQLTSCLS